MISGILAPGRLNDPRAGRPEADGQFLKNRDAIVIDPGARWIRPFRAQGAGERLRRGQLMQSGFFNLHGKGGHCTFK